MRFGYGVLAQTISVLRLVADGMLVFVAEKTYHIQIEYAGTHNPARKTFLSA
jgi:hypothetical protein